MIQLSILKITGYGPWTLTLGSDREHELQMLQASLYREIQRLFSDRDCLVFQNRADEFFAVSNGLTLDDHVAIQRDLKGSFDVGLTVSVGYGDTPYAANLKAYEGRRDGVVLSREHDIFGFVAPSPDGADGGRSPLEASIMHLDVDDLASQRKTRSPYEISALMFELYHEMSRGFLEKDSLTFFMGGDNFMVVASSDAKACVRDVVGRIEEEKRRRDGDEILLNCGIGTASTARKAASLATRSLDTIREIRDSGGENPSVYELPC